MLLNLVTNALQHAPTGGNVWLTVDRDSGKVIVQVADDGPGDPLLNTWRTSSIASIVPTPHGTARMAARV